MGATFSSAKKTTAAKKDEQQQAAGVAAPHELPRFEEEVKPILAVGMLNDDRVKSLWARVLAEAMPLGSAGKEKETVTFDLLALPRSSSSPLSVGLRGVDDASLLLLSQLRFTSREG